MATNRAAPGAMTGSPAPQLTPPGDVAVETGRGVADATPTRREDERGVGVSRTGSSAGSNASDSAASAAGSDRADLAAGSAVAAADSAVGSAEAPARPRWRERISTTLDVIRANPTGRIALKVFIGVAGLAVVALGVVLIPLPGPGWLIVLGGLGIWAVEYSWARRLLHFTRRNLQKWTRWVGRQSWAVRIVLGLVGMIFVAAVVWLSVWMSFDMNLVTSFLNYLATH